MKKSAIAILITAALVAATPVMAASKFSDVKETDWSAPSINSMVDKKVLNGYADGTFKPNNPVTKGEFAHMYHALFPDVGSKATATSEYVDIKGHWAAKDFAALFKGGWEYADHFSDDGKQYLEPNKKLTRWDMMMLVGLLTKEIDVPKDTNGGSSVKPEEVVKALKEYTDIEIRPAVGFEASDLYKPIILTYDDGNGLGYGGDNDLLKADNLYASITLGVIVGADGKFRPSDKVTRAEAVTILDRIYTNLVNK